MSAHHDVTRDPRLERLLDALPPAVRRWYLRLMRPGARWLRLPLGGVLIAGGVLGFLPLLGFWMVPLGALLISQDIPIVQRVTLRALGWLQRRWYGA